MRGSKNRYIESSQLRQPMMKKRKNSRVYYQRNAQGEYIALQTTTTTT